jgi:hypothetical protein
MAAARSVGQAAMRLAGGASAGTAGRFVEIAQRLPLAGVDGTVLIVEECLDEGGVGMEHRIDLSMTSQ